MGDCFVDIQLLPPMAAPGRGRVKTQNYILSFRFWRFSMKTFAQNRTTIDFTTVFRSIEIVATCFDTASADCRAMRTRRASIDRSGPTPNRTKRLVWRRQRRTFGRYFGCLPVDVRADRRVKELFGRAWSTVGEPISPRIRACHRIQTCASINVSIRRSSNLFGMAEGYLPDSRSHMRLSNGFVQKRIPLVRPVSSRKHRKCHMTGQDRTSRVTGWR